VTPAVAVMVGGAAGALARAGLAEALPTPWATFLANVAGTALLAWLVQQNVSRHLLGTGFCGALTTFSTFQVETIELAHDSVLLAAAYALGSIAAGMAVARLVR
jgi:fluoride exporter